MKEDKVFLYFKRVISQNLYNSYNKNTPKISFNITNEIKQNSGKYKYKCQNVTLCIENFTGSVNVSEWRLPQTRIYYSKLENSLLRIEILKYFDCLFLLIENKSNQNTANISLEETSSPMKVIDLQANNEITLSTIVVKSEDSKLLFLCLQNELLPENLKTYFNEVIQTEKDLHPITQIGSLDNEFLMRVDELWAQMNWQKKDKLIPYIDDQSDSFTSLILANELYEFLGWEEEQQKLTKSIKDTTISGLFVGHKNSPKNKIQKDEMPFQDIYFGRYDIFVDSSKDFIQKTWNRISLPSQTVFLKKLITEKSEEMICFLILAVKNHFWWASQAIETVRKVISNNNEISPIFDLFFLLQQRFGLFRSNEGFNISTIEMKTKNACDAFKRNEYEIKFVKNDLRYITSFYKNDTQIFSIDKRIFCYCREIDSSFSIVPHIFQYKNPDWNFCEIKIGKSICNIVLAWTDFVVHIGQVRLKFLFKKDKYQLSIKGAKEHADILINNNQVSFAENLYHKMIIPVTKSEKTFKDFYFNDDGFNLSLQKLPNFLTKFYFHAVATNQFKQIIQNVHIQKLNSKKSVQVNPLKNPPDQVPVSNNFNIIVPKTDQIKKVISLDQSLICNLLQTEAHILENQLAIWLEDESTLSQEKYSDSIFLSFGFYPIIHSLNNLNTALYKYNIIVSQQSLGIKKLEFDFCYETLLKKEGNKRVIVVIKDQFFMWVKTVFINKVM